MTNKIKECLKSKIEEWMQENSISWYMLQNKELLKKAGCPVSYGTLFKIVRKDDYNKMTPSKQEKLLKFFKVKHKRVFAKIELQEDEQ